MSNARKPLSGLWYFGALCLGMIGLMIGVAVAGSAWDKVRAAPITSVNQALDARGSSIAVFTDVMQADLAIACAWTSGASSERHRIPDAPPGITVEDDGLTWQLIAFERQGRDDMKVQCKPTRGRTDSAQYAYAVVDGWNQRAIAGSLVAWGSLLVAAIIAIVVYLRRRRGRMTA